MGLFFVLVGRASVSGIKLVTFVFFFPALTSRWPMERKVVGTVAMGRARRPVEDDEHLPPKLILKDRNPCLTPTESCVSDESEEEEEKPLRAPLGLSDPIAEDMKRRDSRLELHGGVQD